MVDPKKIEAAVNRAEAVLEPDVVRIRYSLEEDWTGADSIYFRVLLSDGLGHGNRLVKVAQRVSEVLREGARPEENGLQPYFNFRTVSEQAAMKDPEWD